MEDPVIKVIEECSELIQILCKVRRFGWFNWHPDNTSDYLNFDQVKREMHDVVEACEQLEVHMRQVQHSSYNR